MTNKETKSLQQSIQSISPIKAHSNSKTMNNKKPCPVESMLTFFNDNQMAMLSNVNARKSSFELDESLKT